MELYESGQLEKSDILDKIINEQEILNIFFRRSISNATRANTAMKLVRRFDNDNTEAHHITDGIATALKLDDNAARIQVLYATLPCKIGEECCKVYIVPGRKIGGFMTKIEES